MQEKMQRSVRDANDLPACLTREHVMGTENFRVEANARAQQCLFIYWMYMHNVANIAGRSLHHRMAGTEEFVEPEPEREKRRQVGHRVNGRLLDHPLHTIINIVYIEYQ